MASDTNPNRPTGIILPPALRRELGIPDPPSSPTASIDDTCDPTYPPMVPALSSETTFTPNELRQYIHRSYDALASLQRQLYRGEETYFEESYAHGNLFAGWDNIWIEGGAENSSSAAGGEAGQQKSASTKKMPTDYRWFSSSCGINPRDEGSVMQILGRESLREQKMSRPSAEVKSTSPLKVIRLEAKVDSPWRKRSLFQRNEVKVVVKCASETPNKKKKMSHPVPSMKYAPEPENRKKEKKMDNVTSNYTTSTETAQPTKKKMEQKQISAEETINAVTKSPAADEAFSSKDSKNRVPSLSTTSSKELSSEITSNSITASSQKTTQAKIPETSFSSGAITATSQQACASSTRVKQPELKEPDQSTESKIESIGSTHNVKVDCLATKVDTLLQYASKVSGIMEMEVDIPGDVSKVAPQIPLNNIPENSVNNTTSKQSESNMSSDKLPKHQETEITSRLSDKEQAGIDNQIPSKPLISMTAAIPRKIPKLSEKTIVSKKHSAKSCSDSDEELTLSQIVKMKEKANQGGMKCDAFDGKNQGTRARKRKSPR